MLFSKNRRNGNVPTLNEGLFGKNHKNHFSTAATSIRNFEKEIELIVPPVNICETDSDFKIELMAPGRKAENFKLDIENNIMNIIYKQSKRARNGKEHYTLKEFSYGNNFSRSFRLPENILIDNIKGNYENGVLKFIIPKRGINISTHQIEISKN